MPKQKDPLGNSYSDSGETRVLEQSWVLETVISAHTRDMFDYRANTVFCRLYVDCHRKEESGVTVGFGA